MQIRDRGQSRLDSWPSNIKYQIKALRIIVEINFISINFNTF